ncbi:Transcription elongation factor spt6 [Rhodotorula kratochvilovae]
MSAPASPAPSPAHPPPRADESMHSPAASDDDDDDEGIDLRPGAASPGDSSEEEATDSEEERELRKGFIVDEDDSSRRRRKHKKRRKHRSTDGAGSGDGDDGTKSRKRRKGSDDEDAALDEDDLELLEENMGIRLTKPKGNKLRRLRRARSASGSDGGSPARGGRSGDLQDIFADDDERAGGDDDGGIEGLFDADEMAGFIEDDTDESRSEAGDSDEDDEARRQRRRDKKAKQKADRKKRRGAGLGMMGRIDGITQEARQEVAEVFGNGQDFAWAMEDDDEEDKDGKKELKDIFEPSEIASRMLTAEDDKIRRLDVPERQQIASAGLPDFAFDDEGTAIPLIPEEEISTAARWMADRLGRETTEQYLLQDARTGLPPPLHGEFLAAVENVVRFLNVELLEPPHIWHHRADYLFHAPSGETPHALLYEDHLWRLSALSIKYRAFLARRAELQALVKRLGVNDAHVDELVEQAAGVEEVMDAQVWVALMFGEGTEGAKRAAAKKEEDVEGEGVDAAEKEKEAAEAAAAAAAAATTKRPKRAARESEYEVAKKSVVRRLAELISIPVAQFALDVSSGTKVHFVEDPDKRPLDLADEFVVAPQFPTREKALAGARAVLVHELGSEPILRKEARRYLRDFGVVNVAATKAGEQKIDSLNPFYAFKYLKNKPLKEFLRSPQWMQILAAEADGLVTASIDLPQSAYDRFLAQLAEMYTSDYASALADEWNALRREILEEVLRTALLPQGAAWARNYLKEEGEEFVGDLCKRKLESRIDAAPWCRGDDTMQPGETPSVLALSNGRGDPKRDSIFGVFLDADGHFREHLQLDRLTTDMEEAQREQFAEFLKRRRPQVVVVGGFSPAATALLEDFRRFAGEVSREIVAAGDADDDEADADLPYDVVENRKANRAAFESTFVFDDVARIYQHGARAAQEFTELSTLGKYCVGLARYAQSPLNEYAALGADLSALTYDPNQKYVSKDKVVQSLERALIEVTNRVGVDINKAVRNQYYAHLLQYVSGMGPRKAEALIKKIAASANGTLTTRNGLIMHNYFGKQLFLNASGFLRIRQDDLAADLGRDTEEQEDPDVLDDTRIHPEDYDVARKMAADAMEYDEEDLEGAPPSKAVADLLEDDVRKLHELALDEFAEELSKVLQQPKRLTLYKIREELQRPFGEKRQQFRPPSFEERFTMLTGETRKTLDGGLIIPVRVLRVSPEEAVIVKLDCGITGHIAAEFRTDATVHSKLRPGQTLQAMVMEVKYEQMSVELSTQENLIATGDRERRITKPDAWFDGERAAAEERLARSTQQRQTGGKIKRVIKHPNFHDVSAGGAEQILASMQRGDCVIRPSSREDHIAVTWKVDEGIYQHLAVHELNKPNEYSLGTQLRTSDKHRYSDLDELIDAHVKQMARKVTELASSDRFKGTKDQLDKFLQNWTLANPGRSIYAFGWSDDRKKAGQVVLGFRTNEKSPIQYWPVSIVPEGYMLRGDVHGDVQSLINAFKIAYQASMAGGARNLAPGAGAAGGGGATNRYLGGNTPNLLYGPGGNRTPAYGQPMPQSSGRTPGYAGGRTPGYGQPPMMQQPPPGVVAAMGSRTPGYGPGAGAGGTGRTPNPYAAPPGMGPPPGMGMGGATPNAYGYAGGGGYGQR